MNKREFDKWIYKHYEDIKKVDVVIYTGQTLYDTIGSWISIDTYNEDEEFNEEYDDFFNQLVSRSYDIENIDNSTLEDRKRLMKHQQQLVIKLRKWLQQFDIVVTKNHVVI